MRTERHWHMTLTAMVLALASALLASPFQAAESPSERLIEMRVGIALHPRDAKQLVIPEPPAKKD